MMSVSRSRRTQLLEALILLGLLGGALRTIPVLDRVLLLLLAPARVALDLASPGALSSGTGTDQEALRSQERQWSLSLADRMGRAAQPLECNLPEGVRAVEAEVLSRPNGRPDELQVLLTDPRGLRRGSAVVVGDVFLGSLTRIPSAQAVGRAAHLGEVRLLTGRRERVSGKALSEGSPRLVVGGIQPSSTRDGWYLDVHNPQDETRTRGLVLLDDSDPLLAVANGWRLGRVALEPDPVRGGQRVAGLTPLVDHEAGIGRVLVLSRSTEPARERNAPAPGEWTLVRRSMCMTEGARAGIPLLAGSLGGLQAGSAVADGVRLLGRVVRAAPLSGMVRRLRDPGCAVNVLAWVAGVTEEEPFILGRIVSQGVDPDGQLRFSWSAERPFPGTVPKPVQLWTLGGEAGVPGGLLLGTTLLPVGAGPHALVLSTPGGEQVPRHLSVFVNWGTDE